MPIADPVVMPLARELLECFEQELAKVDDPPMHTQLRPGLNVATYITENRDEACEGLGWVRPESFFPSSSAFPAQDETPASGVTRAWAITLELGVVRCAPRPEANEVPSAEEWDTVTQAVMDDAAAMRRAICCFIEAGRGRQKRVLAGAWQPLNVEGGGVGGVMSVTVQGPACDCSDSGPAS